MSVLRLVRDHEGKKAGTQIQVPFVQGRELIAQGIAVDANPATKPGSPPAATSAEQTELRSLRAKVSRLEAENKELREQIDELLRAEKTVEKPVDGKTPEKPGSKPKE